MAVVTGSRVASGFLLFFQLLEYIGGGIVLDLSHHSHRLPVYCATLPSTPNIEGWTYVFKGHSFAEFRSELSSFLCIRPSVRPPALPSACPFVRPSDRPPASPAVRLSVPLPVRPPSSPSGRPSGRMVDC